MGGNRYGLELLQKMGFVLIENRYFVWPSAHLRTDSWGWRHAERTGNSQGMNKDRLADLIRFLQLAQAHMHKTGAACTGFFK